MPMKIPLYGFVFGVFAGIGLASEAEPWARHVIDAADRPSGKAGADGVRLADADGDGRPDVITGWENGDAIRLCFHPGAAAVRSPWPAVTVGRVKGAEDAVLADLDGDGRLDAVTCTEGRTQSVFFHWSPAKVRDSSGWLTEPVPALAGQGKWMFCLPFDTNADGQIDLIIGSKQSATGLGWLKGPVANHRDLSNWRFARLSEAGWIMSIRAVDLDGDALSDVVYSDRRGPKAGVWWLRNQGRVGEDGTVFAAPQSLGFAGDETMFIDVADLDGDGRLDIAAAIRPDRIGYLRQPATAEAAWETLWHPGVLPPDRFGTAKAVRVGDLDGDGRLEIVVTCENAGGARSGCLFDRVRLGKSAGEAAYRDIGGPDGVKFDRIELLDLDGDGDLDVLTCEEADGLGVFWYENPARAAAD